MCLVQQILKVTHVDLPAQVVSHENGKLSLWGALVFKSHASCQQHIKFFNSSNSSKYGNCFLLDQRLINTSIAVKTFLRLRVIITASSSNPPSSISFHGIHQIGAPSSFPVNGLVINAGTGQSRAPSSTRGGIGASLSHSRGSRQALEQGSVGLAVLEIKAERNGSGIERKEPPEMASYWVNTTLVKQWV
ncbi:hypothetical protein WG66_016736 [Moniliophthora roreri]|nr:hypothetical protein WG66_016736 [Moniliophthora roreri]